MKKRPGRGRPRDEARCARRREAILDMATRLFAKRGYPKTDLQEVADALGVGKGTIYRYFPTKEALFHAATNRGMERLMEQVRRESEKIDDPLERTQEAVRAHYRYFAAHPEIIELFCQERAEFRSRKQPIYLQVFERQFGPWERLMTSLMKTRQVRPMPIQCIKDGLGGLIFGVIFTRPVPFKTEREIERLVEIIFHGILSSRRGQR